MTEKVVMFDDDHPQMKSAMEQARESFKYFWRELHWEYRRIVPALDMAAVKMRFVDPTVAGDVPDTEHMWISDIGFDGEYIYGELISSPNWVSTVAQGDEVKTKVNEIEDWIYAIEGKAYGGFTVNLMRSQMPPHEMEDHDNAWGLDFGDPEKIDLVPVSAQDTLESALRVHPMCMNMLDDVVAHLKESPEITTDKDDNGWTMLHYEALAGSTPIIELMLQYGANPLDPTNKGVTALELAQVMGWDEAVAVMRPRH